MLWTETDDKTEVDEMVEMDRKRGIQQEINYLPGDCDLSRGLGGVGGFWFSPVISRKMWIWTDPILIYNHLFILQWEGTDRLPYGAVEPEGQGEEEG